MVSLVEVEELVSGLDVEARLDEGLHCEENNGYGEACF